MIQLHNSSVHNFFNLVKKHSLNRCKTDDPHLCYGKNPLNKTKQLFEIFRAKYASFEERCRSNQGYDKGMYIRLLCPSTDKREQLLTLSTENDGAKLTMSVVNKKDEERVYASLSCIQRDQFTTQIECKGEGNLSSYQAKFSDTACIEQNGTQIGSCDQNLDILTSLLQETPAAPQGATDFTSTAAPTTSGTEWKMAAVAIGGLGLAYLAYQRMQKKDPKKLS